MVAAREYRNSVRQACRRVRGHPAADRARCRRAVVRRRPAAPCRSRCPRPAWRRRRTGAGWSGTGSARCAGPGTPPRVRSASAGVRCRLGDQPVQPGEQVGDPLPEARRSLERQQVDRQLPAVAGIAEHAVARHHHVVEVHLTELVDAVHGAQRPHRDTRCVHVDEEGRDALVLGVPATRSGSAGRSASRTARSWSTPSGR